jgi:hypothetical protein
LDRVFRFGEIKLQLLLANSELSLVFTAIVPSGFHCPLSFLQPLPQQLLSVVLFRFTDLPGFCPHPPLQLKMENMFFEAELAIVQRSFITFQFRILGLDDDTDFLVFFIRGLECLSPACVLSRQRFHGLRLGFQSLNSILASLFAFFELTSQFFCAFG